MEGFVSDEKDFELDPLPGQGASGGSEGPG